MKSTRINLYTSSSLLYYNSKWTEDEWTRDGQNVMIVEWNLEAGMKVAFVARFPLLCCQIHKNLDSFFSSMRVYAVVAIFFSLAFSPSLYLFNKNCFEMRRKKTWGVSKVKDNMSFYLQTVHKALQTCIKIEEIEMLRKNKINWDSMLRWTLTKKPNNIKPDTCSVM